MWVILCFQNDKPNYLSLAWFLYLSAAILWCFFFQVPLFGGNNLLLELLIYDSKLLISIRYFFTINYSNFPFNTLLKWGEERGAATSYKNTMSQS